MKVKRKELDHVVVELVLVLWLVAPRVGVEKKEEDELHGAATPMVAICIQMWEVPIQLVVSTTWLRKRSLKRLATESRSML